jgi:tetratricopeptide (TPR) repeat protein/TolB-like protein
MPADIFLSYASADRERVRPLVESLKARGWSVWWDREIHAGADFQQSIGRALDEARCVVVAWTQASVASQWVRAEATHALDRRLLVPALLDPVKPGPPFNLLNHADLTGWAGEPGHAELARLAQGVEAKLGGAEPPPAAGTPGTEGRGTRAGRRAAIVATALAVALSGAVVTGAWLARAPQPSAPGNSIAVLPFENLGAPDEAYRSLGLSREILDQLARVRELAVVSATSSFAAPGASPDAARRLAVRYLVEGSVRPDGDSATVDVRLLEAATSRVLWSARRTVGGEALAALPSDAVRAIVATLDVALSEESRAQLEAPPTKIAAALDAYLQGLALLRSRPKPSVLAAAEDAFRRAIALDADYAMPYAGLCRVQVSRYETTLDAAHFAEAEASCRRTLSLNALQAEPHKALGGLYVASGRLVDAEAEYGKARRLAPRDADAVVGLADVAGGRGEEARAEKLYREAVALEPVYWSAHAALGRFLFGRARYDEAATAYRRAVELDPAQPRAWEDLGGANYMNGEFEEALAAWQKALALEPGPTAYTNVGTAQFLMRRFDAAAAMYRKAVELAPSNHYWHGNLADALRLAGHAEDARASYERAAELARETSGVNPGDVATTVRLAGYDAALGRVELARLALEEALRLTPRDPYLYYDAAVAWANMGMTAQALDALRDAVRLGYPARLVAADPMFDTLRGAEEFQRIVR